VNGTNKKLWSLDERLVSKQDQAEVLFQVVSHTHGYLVVKVYEKLLAIFWTSRNLSQNQLWSLDKRLVLKQDKNQSISSCPPYTWMAG
jgi:hypothetical protein